MTRRSFLALFALPWLPKPVPRAAGPLTVVINNHSEDRVSQLNLAGRRQLEVLIRESTRRGIQTGQFDRAFRQIYGRSRARVAR